MVRIKLKGAGPHVVGSRKAPCFIVIFGLLSFVILELVHSSGSHYSINHSLSLYYIRSSLSALALDEEVRSGRTSRVDPRWNDARSQVSTNPRMDG